ncbi:MAG: hypothetical protein QW331_04750 [Candidatus Woesearchaeota archaeon]
MTELLSGSKLEEVLKESLIHALYREKVDVSEDTEAYLVLIIRDFARTLPSNATYIGRLSEAKQSNSISVLINLGNHILVFPGFFPEYFERRGNRMSYYAALGSDIFATVYQKTGKAIPFMEISKEFPGILRVFKAMRMSGQDNSKEYWRRIEGLIQ